MPSESRTTLRPVVLFLFLVTVPLAARQIPHLSPYLRNTHLAGGLTNEDPDSRVVRLRYRKPIHPINGQASITAPIGAGSDRETAKHQETVPSSVAVQERQATH